MSFLGSAVQNLLQKHNSTDIYPAFLIPYFYFSIFCGQKRNLSELCHFFQYFSSGSYSLERELLKLNEKKA